YCSAVSFRQSSSTRSLAQRSYSKGEAKSSVIRRVFRQRSERRYVKVGAGRNQGCGGVSGIGSPFSAASRKLATSAVRLYPGRVRPKPCVAHEIVMSWCDTPALARAASRLVD